MEKEELLKILGFETDPRFKNGYSTTYKHTKHPIIIHIMSDDTVEIIADRIYSAGYRTCQNNIKATLGILSGGF